jgi:integrase
MMPTIEVRRTPLGALQIKTYSEEYSSFKRIKTRAGVREDLRFHDLRHTCATLLLGEGVNA